MEKKDVSAFAATLPNRLRPLVPVAAVVLAAAFLLPALGTYSGSLLVWEPSVVSGFEDSFRSGESPAAFLKRCLQWDDGIVSGGHLSLLYGAPTYWLLANLKPTPFVLRILAALATLVAVWVAWSFVRKNWGEAAGGVAAFLVATSPLVLFYGRYGTSVAATLLTLWIAFAAVFRLLAARDPGAVGGFLAGAALFLATLHYSPARIAVVFLAVLLLVVLAGRAFVKKTASPAALAGLVLALGLAFGGELLAKRGSFLFHARGEQVFELLKSKPYLRDLMGREIEPEQMSFGEKTSAVFKLVGMTIPQYFGIARPHVPFPKAEFIVFGDPPLLPLLGFAVFPFFLVGLVVAARNLQDPRNVALLGTIVVVTLPLLLTNRADAHRMAVLVVPALVLVARGIVAAIDWARDQELPAGAIVAVMILIAAGLFWDLRRSRPDGPVPPSPVARALITEMGREANPFFLCIDADHRDVGLAQLLLLDRQPRPAKAPAILLPEDVRNRLLSGIASERANGVRGLERLAWERWVVLAPPERFAPVVETLAPRGFQVESGGNDDFPLVRVRLSRPGAALPASGSGSPVAPPRIEGKRLFVSEMKPDATHFDFMPVKENLSWDGSPLSVRGKVYASGLGMHAPSDVLYAVPAGAAMFEATVGVCDAVSTCERASIIFEIRDEHEKLLYETPVLKATSAPFVLRVPLAGATKLMLVASDAGDGRDCDHAVWGDAAFVVPEAAAAPAKNPK